MNLNNFMLHIDPVIVDRGEDYYAEGNVSGVICVDVGRYRAFVRGSDIYDVNVIVGPHGDITHSECSCPYEGGPFCKHEVAVFYSLAADVKKAAAGGKSSGASVSLLAELATALTALSPEELKGIILELATEDAHLTRALLCQHVSDDAELRVAREIIWSTIDDTVNRASVSGRVVAMRGCDVVLGKAKAHIVAGRIERAIELCMAVLAAAVKVLPAHYEECEDDEDDEDDEEDADDDEDECFEAEVIGVSNPEDEPETVEECLSEVEAALVAATHMRSAPEQVELFDRMHAAMREYVGSKRYDVAIGLLGACGPLATNLVVGRKLREVYQEYWKHLKSTYRGYDERLEALLGHQHAMLTQHGSGAELDAFLLANLAHGDFRKEAVIRALERGDAALALELAEVGLKSASPWMGITWKKHMVAAYAQMGNVGRQREITEDLLFTDGFVWHAQLKALYAVEEWPMVRAKLVGRYEGKEQREHDFMEFLAAEGLVDKILERCRKSGHLLETWYPYLTEHYGPEVKHLFIQHIMRLAIQASSRSAYAGIRRVARLYREACGDAAEAEIIAALRQTYARKHAFMDELSR